MNPRSLLAVVSAALAMTVTAVADDAKTIYNGPPDLAHWKTNTGKPVPAANAQDDGLNPHGSGGYIVIYDQPVKDFVLEFDYKISKGCNSGVFVRVGKAEDPVMTGLEIAIDDTKGTGVHDPGALYDLVGPKVNAQKPAGEWNHMKITAKGPRVAVELNGQEVATLDHDQFPEPGKRPDGTNHKFGGVAIKSLNQKGYLGFQDHGQNCWYKNVNLTVLD